MCRFFGDCIGEQVSTRTFRGFITHKTVHVPRVGGSGRVFLCGRHRKVALTICVVKVCGKGFYRTVVIGGLYARAKIVVGVVQFRRFNDYNDGARLQVGTLGFQGNGVSHDGVVVICLVSFCHYCVVQGLVGRATCAGPFLGLYTQQRTNKQYILVGGFPL